MICKDEKLKKSIRYLEENFPPLIRNLTVYAEQSPYNCLGKKRGNLYISYESRAGFFRMLSLGMFSKKTNCTGTFRKLGVMLDCARNSVPSVVALKQFIATIALAGYTYLGLYLEDCFEVKKEPFFGYMRGRYTQKEVKEIVIFADLFGIEVIPFVQTLAHLGGIFHHWEPYFAQIRDTNDILLMDEPRTYELLENILQSVSEAFGGGRVNIGLDEAFMMTYGKYRELHGASDVCEVFSRHVRKVCNLCQKYDLQPEAWADMFLRHAEKIKIPETLTLRAWHYSYTEETEYQNLLERCKKITDKITFASAVHKWYGYAPLNEYSENIFLTAIRATEGKTEDFCLTLWGDDGAECSYNAVWYSLLRAANAAYCEPYSETELSSLSEYLTGYAMPELLATDLPNKVFDGPMRRLVNVSKYLLFADLFYGIADKAENTKYTVYFSKHKKILGKLAKRNSPYSNIYAELAALCGVLEIKNGLRGELRSTYKKKDYEALRVIVEQRLPLLIRRIKNFQKKSEQRRLKENKPFGEEVQTIRLAGILARIDFIKKTLTKFLCGKLDRIVELDESDLSPVPLDNEYNGASWYNNYEMSVTYSTIAYKLYN